jgi:chromosome segregation ATPase
MLVSLAARKMLNDPKVHAALASLDKTDPVAAATLRDAIADLQSVISSLEEGRTEAYLTRVLMRALDTLRIANMDSLEATRESRSVTQTAKNAVDQLQSALDQLSELRKADRQHESATLMQEGEIEKIKLQKNHEEKIAGLTLEKDQLAGRNKILQAIIAIVATVVATLSAVLTNWLTKD